MAMLRIGCHFLMHRRNMEWISFEKQEPPLKQRILVVKSYPETGCDPEITIDSYHGEWEYKRNRVGRITHWMFLPSLPSEK